VKRVRSLSADQQRAGAAAVALFLTLFLPWYSHPVASLRGGTAADKVSGFEAFSFVEAAVLVVAAAILYLLYARSEQRGFHLPGGDGWAVTVAGGWVAFLLVWRLFDKPNFTPGPVGIEWGLFVALVVAAVIVAMGQRMRAAHAPEPPNPAEDPLWEVPPRRREPRPERRPVDSGAVTRTLRDERPAWEGEPPEHPTRRLPDAPTRRLPAEPSEEEPPPERRKRPDDEDSLF
jgi:hypothetical protein